MEDERKIPGWVGALGIAIWVYYWDSRHETITSFFQRHPILGFLVFTWIWSHIVFNKPKRLLFKIW